MLRALRGETGVVNVLEGGERDTNDLLSCSHYPLKGLAAGRVAGVTEWKGMLNYCINGDSAIYVVRDVM